MGKELDRSRFLTLLVEGDTCLGDLDAELVEVLLHGAQFRFSSGFGIPADDRFDRAVDRLIGFHADEVADE
ncbi:MAG: hypothetical protein P4L90_21350 [Rhodopila sp.]|nr:hypothetical protein [Rhodopila sp.]